MDESEPKRHVHLESLLDVGADHMMLVNKMGKAESVVSKRKAPLTRERQEMFSMSLRLCQSLLEEFDDEFGPVEHFVIFRRKTKIVSVPFGIASLIFMVRRHSEHESILQKIMTVECQDYVNKESDLLPPVTVSHG